MQMTLSQGRASPERKNSNNLGPILKWKVPKCRWLCLERKLSQRGRIPGCTHGSNLSQKEKQRQTIVQKHFLIPNKLWPKAILPGSQGKRPWQLLRTDGGKPKLGLAFQKSPSPGWLTKFLLVQSPHAQYFKRPKLKMLVWSKERLTD